MGLELKDIQTEIVLGTLRKKINSLILGTLQKVIRLTLMVFRFLIETHEQRLWRYMYGYVFPLRLYLT